MQYRLPKDDGSEFSTPPQKIEPGNPLGPPDQRWPGVVATIRDGSVVLGYD